MTQEEWNNLKPGTLVTISTDNHIYKVISTERLLALGLKLETADMRIIPYSDFAVPTQYNDGFFFDDKDYTPAWSLHRLIEILDIWYLDLNFHNFDNAYEQVISYFEERVKGGFINKDYLE